MSQRPCVGFAGAPQNVHAWVMFLPGSSVGTAPTDRSISASSWTASDIRALLFASLAADTLIAITTGRFVQMAHVAECADRAPATRALVGKREAVSVARVLR